MAKRKSSPLIVIGIVAFVVAGALAFVLLRNSGTGTTPAPIPRQSAPTTLAGAGSPAVSPAGGGSFTIPPGKNAVPVQVSALAGLDGYARAGDLINIFANIQKVKVNVPGLAGPPTTKLVLSNVKVLTVLSPPPTASPTGTAVFVLALDPGQAEQIIFLSTNESLYFTLVPASNPPASTPGRTYQDAV